MRKMLFGLIPLVAAAAAGWLAVLDRQGQLVWDHWDEAKRGVLYRSGQLTGASAHRSRQSANTFGPSSICNCRPGVAAERSLSRPPSASTS